MEIQTDKYKIFDGHNDVFLDLFSPRCSTSFSFFERSNHKHLDLPRALEAGFLGGLFAIMVESNLETKMDPEPPKVIPDKWAMPYPNALDYDYCREQALTILDGIKQLESDSNGSVRIIRTVDDITDCFKRRIMAVGIHFEGAEPIDPNLKNLQDYYDSGLRSVGLVWSRPNAFAHGVPIEFPGHADHGPGLSDAGKCLVRACSELGIMIDMSHLNEKGFWDVEKLGLAPLVATHSNVHALCASSRNLTDRQLDAIGASNGIVGMNFAVYFLREDGQPKADTPLETIVKHIDYIANRIGIEHVALGSDFNGALIPDQIGDVTGLVPLISALENHGFSIDDIRKVTSENWLRVLRDTW